MSGVIAIKAGGTLRSSEWVKNNISSQTNNSHDLLTFLLSHSLSWGTWCENITVLA